MHTNAHTHKRTYMCIHTHTHIYTNLDVHAFLNTHIHYLSSSLSISVSFFLIHAHTHINTQPENFFRYPTLQEALQPKWIHDFSPQHTNTHIYAHMHTDTHIHKLECTRPHLHTFIYTNTVSRFRFLSCYLSFSLMHTRKQLHSTKVRASIARKKKDALEKYKFDAVPSGCMEDLASSLHELGCDVWTIKTESRDIIQERLRCVWQGCLSRARVFQTQTIAHTYTFMSHTNESYHTYIQES